MKNPALPSPFAAFAVSMGLFLVTSCGLAQDPQIPYTYASQNTGAYSPGPAYQPNYQTAPYSQQPMRQTRRNSPPPQAYNTAPPQQHPYGQLPYAYPQGQQPQPKKVPHGPEYQYGPRPVAQHSAGTENLAHEVEELKAKERRQDRRIDMLESRLNEREQGRSLNPPPSSSPRGLDGPIYHMPAKGRGSRDCLVEEPRPARTSGTYVVRRGDSLGLIAKQNGVSKSAILSANSIRHPDKLAVGQKLVIPGRSLAASPTKMSSSHKTPAPKMEGPRYVVSKKTHSTVEAPRMEVVTPSSPSAVASAPPPGVIPPPSGSRGVTSYRVEPGDTIEGVARSFGTSVAEIKNKNKLPTAHVPAPGEEIIVPLPGSVSS